MVLFTIWATKKETKNKDRGFDFMNVLLASKNLEMTWKYDKSLKNIMDFS